MEKENENTSKVDNKDEISNNENNSENEQKEELKIEDKLKDTEDKLTRSYAELENQRRRYEKEKDEAYEYGGMALAKECLNLTDNLERSKLSIINDESLEKSNKDKIIEHLDIIYKDILSIFKKNQIDEISALGEKLDPNKHQAMLEIEDSEKEQGIIVQE
uniref:nucleotide exchange factor GrpE n=1 Tax=Pelagibacter ubique TaxID=198252 RepID=UPI00094DD8D0